MVGGCGGLFVFTEVVIFESGLGLLGCVCEL